MINDYPSIMNSTVFMSETPFHFLVVENFINAVRFLIEQRQDTNVLDEYGSTAFERAVSIELYEITELLLKHGADPNRPPSECAEYVIVKAIRNEDDKMSKLLIEHGADIDSQISSGVLHQLHNQKRDYQSFCQAVGLIPEKTDFTALAKQLLEQPESSAPRIFMFKSTLYDLAANNRLEAINHLLQTKQGIYQSQSDLDTALIYAAKNNHLNLAQLLISTGANPNAFAKVYAENFDWMYTQNSLREALQANHFKMCKLLLDHGADIEICGDYGKQILPDLDQIIEDSKSH
ncbi:ankyrin repeat domain-containing protein [Poriferisphaera sp. WC338]|uniref:ankyrin repeat domain-containing protein n=1 Tax=Poriferisphaera sp. WC338 TaxID=3425129 RepID=UPI003D814894